MAEWILRRVDAPTEWSEDVAEHARRTLRQPRNDAVGPQLWTIAGLKDIPDRLCELAKTFADAREPYSTAFKEYQHLQTILANESTQTAIAIGVERRRLLEAGTVGRSDQRAGRKTLGTRGSRALFGN